MREELLDCLKKLQKNQLEELIFVLEERYAGITAYLVQDKDITTLVLSLLKYVGQQDSTYQILSHALKRFTPPLPQPAASGDRLQHIARLLNPLPVSMDEVHALCRQALPGMSCLHVLPAQASLEQLLKLLARKGQLSDRNIPLLEVLQKLSKQLAADRQQVLIPLLEEIAEEFAVRLEDVAELSDTERESPAPYLLIELWPVSKDAQTYNAQAWLYHAAAAVYKFHVRDSYEPQAGEEKPKGMALAELPALLEELLACLDRVDIDHAALCVEFFLPTEMLGFPIEREHIHPFFNETDDKTLGVAYPVAVRSRERLRNPPLQRFWKNRRIDCHEAQACQCAAWFSQHHEARKISSELRNQKECCILKFEPTAQNFFSRMLEDGVSIALWMRGADQRQQVEKELSGLLNCALGSLPRQVQGMRDQAWQEIEDKNHAGNHVALFWDMPDRLPDRLTPTSLGAPKPR